MGKGIVARWEWRTFGKSFEPHLELIRDRNLGNYKISREVYILSKNSSNNVKIRNQTIEVKTLQATNNAGLEQWYPAMKARFPLTCEQLTELGRYLMVRMPSLRSQEGISISDLLHFISPYACSLKTVQVNKRRYIYVIEECILEYVKATVEGRSISTICVEQADDQRVIDTVKRLGFSGLSNISYIKALKKLTGFYNLKNISKS